MEETSVQAILPGFVKLFPPRTVHVDGVFDFAQDLSEIFAEANDVLVTTGLPDEDRKGAKSKPALLQVPLAERFVFSEKSEEREYFTLSLKHLSGLVHPRHLSRFWKNINLASADVVHTSTLEEFYEGRTEAEDGNVNWLCIGGFKGLDVLKGLGGYIGNIDGLLVRFLTEECKVGNEIGCYSEDLNIFLKQHGLVSVADFGTRHSAFRIGLYVRDFRSALHRDDLERNRNSLNQMTSKNKETEASLAAARAQIRAPEAELTSGQPLVADNMAKQISDLASLKQEMAKLSGLPAMMSDLRFQAFLGNHDNICLLYTSPSPRD